ncbi:MAG TPA: hypothetical protein VIL72_08930 [Beijerinckiaceae bacterium]
MFDLIGLGLMLGGLALSASAFPLALQAARGRGPRKAPPLTSSYWFGLALIVIGAGLQLGS